MAICKSRRELWECIVSVQCTRWRKRPRDAQRFVLVRLTASHACMRPFLLHHTPFAHRDGGLCCFTNTSTYLPPSLLFWSQSRLYNMISSINVIVALLKEKCFKKHDPNAIMTPTNINNNYIISCNAQVVYKSLWIHEIFDSLFTLASKYGYLSS